MEADQSGLRKDRALCGQYARQMRAAHPFADWAELKPLVHRLWKQEARAMRWEVAEVVIRFIWALAPILSEDSLRRIGPTRGEGRR